jgi:hypothetical protein
VSLAKKVLTALSQDAVKSPVGMVGKRCAQVGVFVGGVFVNGGMNVLAVSAFVPRCC